MRNRPKPEQVFYDTLKRLIENQLINDPNFMSPDGWQPSWYEKNNKMHYGLFKDKAKYILERLEDLKHLILDEDETPTTAPLTFHYRTQEGSVIIPDPKNYDYGGKCAELTPLEKFAIYREKYPWLEKSNDHECFNGMHIDKFKIPFNHNQLVDGDRLENESGDSLIYREQDHAYTFINNDFTRFLSSSMIYQEWKKVGIWK